MIGPTFASVPSIAAAQGASLRTALDARRPGHACRAVFARGARGGLAGTGFAAVGIGLGIVQADVAGVAPTRHQFAAAHFRLAGRHTQSTWRARTLKQCGEKDAISFVRASVAERRLLSATALAF